MFLGHDEFRSGLCEGRPDFRRLILHLFLAISISRGREIKLPIPVSVIAIAGSAWRERSRSRAPEVNHVPAKFIDQHLPINVLLYFLGRLRRQLRLGV